MTNGIATDFEGAEYRVVLVDGVWLDAAFFSVAPELANKNPSPSGHHVRLIQADAAAGYFR